MGAQNNNSHGGYGSPWHHQEGHGKLHQQNPWQHQLLTGHPLLSGQQHKSHFFSPTFTVKRTRIERTPLLSGRGHLKLDFMVISIVRNLY